MSANIVNGQLLESYEQQGTIMPDGSAEFTMKYRVPWDNLFSYLPSPLQPHPTFPALLYYDGEVSKEEGAMGNLINRYRGIFASDPISLEQVDGTIATTAEPIETSPVFTGPPGTSPDQSPVTRNDISVVGNALANNSPPASVDSLLSGPQAVLYYTKKLRGIDSFYRTGFTWRRHYCSTSIPDYTNLVGYIVIPPSSPFAPPSPPTGQNYLFSGIGWRQQGGVVTIDEEYQLSGPGGWDTDLYTAPSQ